jgi:Spy/CpxP family protein refolding chaperone
MLRKVTLGLIAAASLSVAALAPGSASAHGFHGGGGWGHHGGWGHGFGFGGLYINTGVSDCYRQQMVPTRHGLRLRTVNVCAYDVY